MEENPLWLVVLCDMMTNLMIFFLIMFVYVRASKAMQQEIARTFDLDRSVAEVVTRDRADPAAPEYTPDQAAAAIQKVFGDAGLADSISIISSERSVRIRLKDRLLFRTAEAALSPAADPALAILGRELAKLPHEMIVEGHTDDIPIVSGPYRTNWELSVARAYAVLERLLQTGLPPGRLVTAGYGEFHPVAPNDSDANRRLNRRVELVILRKPETIPGAVPAGTDRQSPRRRIPPSAEGT